MFITTVMPISTLLKIAFVFIIAIIIIRYVDKLRKTSFRGGKSINYLLKRNTKAFFKNRYNIKEENIEFIIKEKGIPLKIWYSLNEKIMEA